MWNNHSTFLELGKEEDMYMWGFEGGDYTRPRLSSLKQKLNCFENTK